MYYVFDRFSALHPCRHIADYPLPTGPSWELGIRHAEAIPEPLEFVLQPYDPEKSDEGPELPEYFKGRIPLFREDLVRAFREAGVDNLDTYRAIIRDPESNAVFTNYQAVNIIGAISAADMSKSNATIHPGGPVLDVEFDGFTVDAARAGDHLMFRLAENPGAVLVHGRVADYLEDHGFTDLEFLDPGDVAI